MAEQQKSKLVIEFDYEGFCSIPAKNVVMRHALTGKEINGEEYYRMGPAEKSEYVIDKFVDVLKKSDDVEWFWIDHYFKEVTEENEAAEQTPPAVD